MRYLYFSIILLATACSNVISQRETYITPFHRGEVLLANHQVSRIAHKEIPKENFQKTGNAVWLWLDDATLSFINGNTKNAIHSYQKAIEAIDYYCQMSPIEEAGKLILQDECGAYAGEDFEQVLARVYFSFALLHQGDEDNARAILRQCEEVQQRKKEEYRNSRFLETNYLVNPLAKYLFGLLLERVGDNSNAEILYREAGISNQNQGKSAKVLVICHNGNMPEKISKITDASIASTVALEMLICEPLNNFSLASIGGIPVPGYLFHPQFQPKAISVSMGEDNHILEPIYDVGQSAVKEMNAKLPLITARGVARYLGRRGIVVAASSKNEDLGAFADLSMLIANVCTKAETRSWTTLPQRFDMAQFAVEPGTYPVTIFVNGRKYTHHIKVQEGDLCIIHVFNVHPGVTRILVPDRFTLGGFVE